MIEWAMIAVGMIAAVLVLHCKYDDGFFGRLALGGLVLVATIVAIQHLWLDYEYEVDPIIAVFIVCVLGFMSRHAYRWWKAVGAGKCDSKFAKR